MGKVGRPRVKGEVCAERSLPSGRRGWGLDVSASRAAAQTVKGGGCG